MAAPVINQGPPMLEVKNIFFKAYPPIKYFADEAEADAITNEAAFQQFNRSLECSNKHGCIFVTFNGEFYLIRVNDILLAQSQAGTTGDVTFKDLKKLEIKNEAIAVMPNIIVLSNGEDFLAVDTVRGGEAWIVIFRLSDFINQSGLCRPFCEIRCSSSSNSRISSICWNPGDGVGNLVAVNTEDGSLYLAKIIGPNNIELKRFGDGGVRCCCWSPKGKQLVIGRMNGSLSQLRLDLTEAKQIPGPQSDSLPVSILWTQTTQFLVVFRNEGYLDFMQLDVPKGLPPTYTNNGDIFISEAVPEKCSCFYIPLMQWNAVLTMSNTSSDVVVLVKVQQNLTELWIPADITDNRRAAFLLDNYARGACVYNGCGDSVSFSEVESYSPMPMVFLLSQRGSLLNYSVVNSDPQAASFNVDVSYPIPDTVFASAVARPTAPVQFPAAQTTPKPQQQQQPSVSTSFFQVPQPQQTPSPLFQIPQQTSSPLPGSMAPVSFQLKNTAVSSNPAPLTSSSAGDQASQKSKITFGLPQTVDTRQLGTSTLPTAQDMAGLQKAVEEKRREMTTQLQKGVSLKGLEDDDQCAFVISEIRKFEQRLRDFKSFVDANRGNLTRLVNTSFDVLEKRVLSTLNVVEDFSSDMESTTNAQKEEVDVLKERILNHFSQLEYAKSLVERSRDPRYLEHLRSRPLDPASQQKFEDIKKLHNYLKNQVAECRRYFYEQSRKRDFTTDRSSYTQLIYLTLSNHSKIIRRLKSELDNIKERLGLGRHNTSYEDTEYLAVCEASYLGAKQSSVSDVNEDPDEITLNDLTAGISKVKLNRESDRPDKKPIKLANRKLFILKKRMPEVTVVKVKADEASWTRSPTKTASRPKPMTCPTIPAPTTRLMNSKTTPITNSSEIQNKSALPSTTFTVKSEPFKSANSPQQSSLFAGTSVVPTPNIDFGSMIKSSISEAANASSPSKPVATPVSTNKTVEIPFASNPKTQTSGSLSSILKSPLSVPNTTGNDGGSPSNQSPTLASLLATPVSNPLPSNLFSPSSGISFTSSTASNTLKQHGTALPFATVPFSFGTQQTGATPNQASQSTITGVSSISSGETSIKSSLPSIAPASSAIGILPGLGTGLFSTSSAIHSFGGSATSTVTPSVTKTTASTVPTISSSLGLSDTQGKIPGEVPSSRTTESSSSVSGAPSSTATSLQGTAPKKSTLTSSVDGSPTSTAPQGQSVDLRVSSVISGSRSATAADQNPVTSTSLSSALGSTSIFGDGKITFGTSTNSGGAGLFANVPGISSSGSKFTSPTITSSPTTKPDTTTNEATTTASEGTVSTPSSELFTTTTSSGVFLLPTTTTGGLFSSNTTSTTSSSLFSTPPVATEPGSLFSSASSGSLNAPASTASGLFTSPPASTTPSNVFTSPPATTTPSSVFTPPPASTVPSGVFTSPPASTAPSGLFTTPPASSAASGLFSSTPAPATPAGLFSSVPASTAAGGLFSSVPSTTTSTTPSGLFGSSNFFSPNSTGTGFMSSLSISDPANKPITTTTTSTGGLFSSSAFGTTATTASSIFGGGSAFGSQAAGTGQGSGAGSAAQTGFGVFGQQKPAAGVFGSPTQPTSTVFGGSATFGGSSPFGSSFGGGGSTFGSGAGAGSVFGSSATSTSQSTGFGSLAQQSTTTSAFGGGSFGSNSGQQQSIFGSPAQQKPAGLFTSPSFGTPAATSAGVFGGGGSVFGTSAAGGGAFSAGANTGGVAQQGFGFGQAKPSTGSAFGSPPAAAPVFGGGATFGSSSPFGSSFASSPNSTFGSTGASVFGGGSAAAPNTGFGTLAQQGSTSPGFGGAPAAGFGVSQPPQQTALFGSPQQQQQTNKPVFGGQAFSSWR